MLIKYILTKRIQYLFCPNQNYTVYHSVKDRLINYPYSDLNEKVQRIRLESKPKDFLSQNIIEDSIAYAALTEHKQNILINYHKYLFMGIQFQDNVSGADIFIRYFGPKLEQLASTIKNSTNEEQVSYCLKILFYLKSSNYKMDIQKLSLNNIITSCTIDQKAFLLYILSEQKNFLSFIETFNQQFKNSTQERKEKAAFILLSIPNFHKALPSTLCEQSIDIVGEAIHKKTDWQIYRVMQYIFETDYPATRRLADKIMDHLLDKNQDVNNNTKIPVIVKAIKLRDTLKMDNKKFEEKIKDNPLKFNSIFFKKKVNKQPFLQTVASKDSQRILPAEISGLFNSYIIKGLNQIIQSKQCDTDQLAQIIKLSLKFYSNIQNPKLFKIVQQIEILFPMFDQSYEILFWLMVLLLRIDKTKLKNPQIAKYAYKMIDFYGEQSKRSLQKFQKSKNIEKVVQIYYHIIRCRVMLQNPSKLLEIDFKNVRTFQQIIYSCIIIIHSPLKNEQNYQILWKFNERLSQHLKQNNFKSLKNIYTVLSAMENSKCQAFYKSQDILNLYRSIQKSFMIKLFKQTICPPRKDLIFLKKMYRDVKMPNQEHKHFTKFLNFLSDCLDHPSQFKKHYKAYQQSLKTFNPIQIDPRKKKY